MLFYTISNLYCHELGHTLYFLMHNDVLGSCDVMEETELPVPMVWVIDGSEIAVDHFTGWTGRSTIKLSFSLQSSHGLISLSTGIINTRLKWIRHENKWYQYCPSWTMAGVFYSPITLDMWKWTLISTTGYTVHGIHCLWRRRWRCSRYY